MVEFNYVVSLMSCVCRWSEQVEWMVLYGAQVLKAVEDGGFCGFGLVSMLCQCFVSVVSVLCRRCLRFFCLSTLYFVVEC